jgi:hypothetical protein
MSAPGQLDGTGGLVDAIARQTMLETGGLDSMVRGFRKGVKRREGLSPSGSNDIAPAARKWAELPAARISGRGTFYR